MLNLLVVAGFFVLLTVGACDTAKRLEAQRQEWREATAELEATTQQIEKARQEMAGLTNHRSGE